MSTLPGPELNPTFRPDEVLPGRVFLNRYRVVRVLGRGAMGEVLEVLDRHSGLSYALKRVPPELVRDAGQMQSIRANFALVSQLAHPHIATTRHLDLDAATGHVYLILELVRGTDLLHWIAEQRAQRGQPDAPLPLSSVLGIAEQIAAALDFAHALPVSRAPDGKPSRYGILHRDLKPANVMLDTAREFRAGVPYVKLVDFGLAAEIQASMQGLSAAPQRENAAGTLSYMAPEQWDGRTLTRGIDQWALAVLMYEMAAGRKPFAAGSPQALFVQVKNASPEPPAALNPAQWAALRKAFSADRRQRYSSCVALVRALASADQATAGSVVSAELPMPDEFAGVPPTSLAQPLPPPETRGARPPRTAPVSSALRYVAALLLFTGVGVGVYYASRLPADGIHDRPLPVPPPPGPDPGPAPEKDATPVWKPLRVVWEDNPAFELWCAGTGFKNEGAARSGLAPLGGWIEIAVPAASTAQLYHTLRWEGQPEIYLRQSDGLLEMSERSAGPWKPLSGDLRALPLETLTSPLPQSGLELPSLILGPHSVSALFDALKRLRLTAVTCTDSTGLETLALLPSLRRLNLNSAALSSAESLKPFRQLTALDLRSNGSLAGLSGLAKCDGLEVLRLSGCPKLQDLTPLEKLKNLRELGLPPTLDDAGLRRLRAAGVLDKAVQLGFQGCEQLRDLEPLRNLKHLSGLDLSNCKNLLNLDPLGELRGLRYLSLPPKITASALMSLRTAGALERVSNLCLYECEALDNLSALRDLPELTSLSLSQAASLASASALQYLPNLRELRVTGELGELPAGELASLKDLRRLALPSSTTNEMLQHLRNGGVLDRVVYLSLDGARAFTAIESLKSLPDLRKLSAENCVGLAAAETQQKLRQMLPGCEITGLPDPPLDDEMVLNAPLTARLQQFPAAVGAFLHKGDPIGQVTGFETSAREAKRAAAKAALDSALASFQAARSEYERAKSLFAMAALSSEELDRKRTAKEVAAAAAIEAQTEWALEQGTFNDRVLRMPFDGVIVKYHAEIGESIQAGKPFLTVRRAAPSDPRSILDKIK